MKITWKLALSFMLMVLLLLGVSVYALISMSAINQNSEEMYAERLLPISSLGKVSRLAENTRVQMLEAGKSLDQTYTDSAEQNIEEMNEMITEFDALAMSNQEKNLYDRFSQHWNEYVAVVTNNISLVKQGNVEELQKGVAKAQTPFREARTALGDLISVNEQLAEQLLVKNHDSFVKTRLLFILGIIIATGAAIVIAVVMGRKITRPITVIQEQATLVANGDLTGKELPVKSRDEIGQLTDSFNRMMKGLQTIVGTVRRSSDELAAASEEMAASSEQVTAGTDEMAHSIHQVAEDAETGNQKMLEAAGGLQELSSLIETAKQKALSATENSKTTHAAAENGKTTVEETIARMAVIKEKTLETENLITVLDDYSKEISVITETITGLADQTNLLALNAAIEAARAGESGRGFAIVADEVRKLAEQSNKGASKVAELAKKVSMSTAAAVVATQMSREEVEEGVTSVTKAGEALDRIMEAVKMTVRDMKDIEATTKSEVAISEKTVELIQSLAEIIENTASNAQNVSASSEETSAAMQTVASSAEEMSAMSNELKAVVERFKTNE